MQTGAKGGTIIEVLIAALIFAGALFALVAFQVNLLHSRGLISQQTNALHLAEDKMQAFRNYTVLHTTPGFFAYDDIQSGSSNTTLLNTTYTMTWTVTDSNQPTRKNVTIQVQWTDSTNTTRTTTIYGIIAWIDPTGTGRVSQGLPA